MLESPFIFGVDLAGVCADYTAALRPIAAEWLGVPVESLAPDPGYDFPEWNLGSLVDVHLVGSPWNSL